MVFEQFLFYLCFATFIPQASRIFPLALSFSVLLLRTPLYLIFKKGHPVYWPFLSVLNSPSIFPATRYECPNAYNKQSTLILSGLDCNEQEIIHIQDEADRSVSLFRDQLPKTQRKIKTLQD